MRAVALSCLLLAAPASAVPPRGKAASPGVSGCERLPAAWKLDEMAGATFARAQREAIASTQVLAWEVDEDDRPLRVEEVLLVVTFRNNSTLLANLYRHPHDRAPAWRVSDVTDVPYVGQEAYAKRPGRKELDRFLSDTWWTFRARDGFKILDKEVCQATWRAIFGEAPWHTYPR